MSFQLVIDPETKEEKYEWVDKTESSADQQRREITEARENREPVDLKAAAIGTAKAIPRMFVNAGINAVQEGSDTIRDIGGYMGIGEGTTFEEPDKPILGLGDWKPEPLESSGVVEDIGTGILQFGLEWVLLTKALRLANFGLKATPLAKPLTRLGTKAKKVEAGLLKTVGKSPIAPRTAQDITKFGIKTATATSPKAAFIDFAGFDQYEGRLYDLAANSNTWFNNVKHIPLVNQLATNPEDEGLKGRFKNALEGGFIDLGIGGAISSASAYKVINARVQLAELQKLVKGTPEYARQMDKVIAAGAKLETVPEIKTATVDNRVKTRRQKITQPVDIVKERRVKVEGDLDSIRQQIDELGPEPPRPGKGQTRTKEGKWTPAFKRWDKWNRRNKSLQTRLTELTTQADEAPLSPSTREISDDSLKTTDTGEMRVDDQNWYDQEGRPLVGADASNAELSRSAFMQRAKDIADGIESGDLPYFYGPEGKVDEAIAAQIIEGRSINEIIENLKRNVPKAFAPIGEAKGVSLSAYRGAEKIIKRLKDQVGKQGFSRSQSEGIEEFIDTIGRHLFDDVAFSFNSKIGAPGQFSFTKKLVEIRSKVIQSGDFEETMIHELWHSLSRYLPEADLKRYFKEWKNQRAKYEASMKKKFKFYDEDGTPSGMKKMKKMMKEAQTKADAELKATGEISEGTIKEIEDIANHSLAYTEFTQFLSGTGYTKQNYRFKEVDEYFAEMLTDHFMLNYTPVDFAPKGTFRRLIQEIGIFFKELWIEIQARIGPHNTEKIFNDYLKGRNNKKLRKYSLETYFEPEIIERIKNQYLEKGIEINEAAQEFNVISGSAFDDGFTKQRVNFEPDELADLSDFISSFEDPSYDKLLRKIEAYIYPEKGAKKAPYPINEKDGERIDDLLDILEEESPKTYREWEWMRNEPVETSAERKIRTDAEDQARFEEESRLYEEDQSRLDEDQTVLDQDQARQEAGDDPRGFYEQEAKVYDEEQARRGQEPAGGKRTEEEVEGLSEDVIEAFEKINSGEADLLDTPAAWQDVTTLRSPKGREYYPGSSAEGGDFEVILDALTHRFDKIMETGMWSVSPQRIAKELGAVFKEQGINLDAILYDKGLIDATEVFANNVENITNLLKIRFGLNFAGEQSAKWARLVYQSAENPSINKADAIAEMMRHLETTLQFSRVYQTWTRSAGQLLNSAQAEIIADGLTESTKRTKLNFDKIEALSVAAEVPAQTIVSNLPDEILTAMKTGEWTPEAEGFFDQLVMYAMNTNSQAGIKTLQDYIGASTKAQGMRRKPTIPNYERIGKGLANYWVNNLLSAAGTWAVQFSGLGRAGIEPLSMSLTALGSRDLKHARLALMQYDYLRRSFYGALKLGAKAFEIGQSLYDPKVRTAAFASDLADDVNINATYAKDRAYQLDDPHPSFDLNTSPFTKEGKGNPGLNVANVLWRLGTWNIRGQLALDTFTKAISGNALSYVTGVEQGLNKGKSLGLKGIELQNYARKYAEGRIDFYTFDAVVNGETIADALMKDEAAIQMGRILTFTNETRARMPARNYQYGEELAKARGITDEKEIAEFAELYQQGGHLEGLEKRYNNFTQGNVLNEAKNNQSLPDSGEVTPVVTSLWSQIPMRWGKLQASSYGFVFSFIQPFNRSPGDITKQWVRQIPGAAMTVDSFYADLFNENYFLRNRWKAEQATGLAASAVFATAVLNDEEFPIEFTGFGPNDPGLRKSWTDNERPPLSWRWRGRDKDGNPSYGKWRSYRGFEPAATFIGGLADYKMLYADMSEEQRDSLIENFNMSITAQVVMGRFNAAYYKGITEFLDALGLMRNVLPGRREIESSERTKLDRYVQRLLINFIPEASRLREVSRAIDPYKREIDSGVNPKEAFEEVDKGLVQIEDNQGRIIYLEKKDVEGMSGTDEIMNFVASRFRQTLDEMKNNLPGFSKRLPPRINWITGLPIRNKGFLGSNQLPMDDAPWLSQLTAAYFGTIKGAVSNFGIGATGQEFDPRLEIQKKKGTETYEYKAAIVNDELIKLNRAGDVFEPPRPTDFNIKGVRLSPPAFRQYKKYIYSLPHPKYGGLTLTEALYQRISSKDYQAQDYKVHPIDGTDPLEGFDRSDEIQEIINDYKTQAKQVFKTDGQNPYRMEIQIPEARLDAANQEKEQLRRSGPLYNQSDSMGTSTQEFTAQLNQ